MLEQIPFLQNCEDEDSDEDDELDSVQHKKQRVKVCFPLPLQGGARFAAWQPSAPVGALGAPFMAQSVCGLTLFLPRVPVSSPAKLQPQCCVTARLFTPTPVFSQPPFRSHTFLRGLNSPDRASHARPSRSVLSRRLASSLSHRDIFRVAVAFCLFPQ